MDFGVKGKTVIVTGGATGIGHAIAKTFHEEGATVVIAGRPNVGKSSLLKTLYGELPLKQGQASVVG